MKLFTFAARRLTRTRTLVLTGVGAVVLAVGLAGAAWALPKQTMTFAVKGGVAVCTPYKVIYNVPAGQTVMIQFRGDATIPGTFGWQENAHPPQHVETSAVFYKKEVPITRSNYYRVCYQSPVGYRDPLLSAGKLEIYAPPEHIPGTITFHQVLGGKPGGTASVTAQAGAASVCDISVSPDQNTMPIAAPGLVQKTAGADGLVTWTWTIPSNAQPGNWRVAVSCDTSVSGAEKYADTIIRIVK